MHPQYKKLAPNLTKDQKAHAELEAERDDEPLTDIYCKQCGKIMQTLEFRCSHCGGTEVEIR